VPTPPTTPCPSTTDTSSSSVIHDELAEAKESMVNSSCASDSSTKSSSSVKPNHVLSSDTSTHLTNDNEDNTKHCTKSSSKVLEESSSVPLDSQLPALDYNNGRNDTNNNSSSSCEQNFTIYDMDSKSTERRSPCEFPATLRGTKRRRISGCETQNSLSVLKEETVDSPALQIPSKRRRRSDGEDEEEERSSSSSEEGDGAPSEPSSSLNETSLVLNDSGYHGETSSNEVSHPAFRGTTTDSSSSNRNCNMVAPNGQSSMEIDQITSLVSIFSFGQHIMAAQQMAASSSTNSSTTTLPCSVTSLASPTLSTVPSSCLSSSLTESTVQLMSTKKDTTNEGNNDKDEEVDISKDRTSEQLPRRIRRRGREKKNATNENAASGEGSDSESDTSSDSGHSSDDHDNLSEDKSSDTADDKSDEDISATESLVEEGVSKEPTSCRDILLTKIGKRPPTSPSGQTESFSCGGEKTKTSCTKNVHSEPCHPQVASV
jgi:hypothetical protein